ncbi:MAG: hypothetical protein IJV48_03995 [Ruminococcus sp.]|nr:hypothetical protein [Ruminococcus sp.]
MASRRMFSLQVIDTDKFIEMSISARLLYYELGMRADDDGFVSSPLKIIRSVGCSTDDLKLLIAKGYVLSFDNGIIVIRHWKMNNYIQTDRYKKTIYQEEAQTLTLTDNVYNANTDCIQPVYIGKDRLGEDRLGKDNISSSTSVDRQPPFDYQSVIDCFNSTCVSLPKVQKLTNKRRKAIRNAAEMLDDMTFADLFQKVEQSDFLTGRSGKWSCGFDWIMKPANLTKIIEGNYQNQTKSIPDNTDYSKGW